MIWILGIIYFIIGVAVSVYTRTEEVDLEPEDLFVVIIGAWVWPIFAVRLFFNYITKQYTIKYGTRVLVKRRKQ